jgi:hypothetical protein
MTVDVYSTVEQTVATTLEKPVPVLVLHTILSVLFCYILLVSLSHGVELVEKRF